MLTLLLLPDTLPGPPIPHPRPPSSTASRRGPGRLRPGAPLPVRALDSPPNRAVVARAARARAADCACAAMPAVPHRANCAACCRWLCRRVALKAADPENDALEECLLVMKPCDAEDSANDDECLDEEVLPAPRTMRHVWVSVSVSVSVSVFAFACGMRCAHEMACGMRCAHEMHTRHASAYALRHAFDKTDMHLRMHCDMHSIREMHAYDKHMSAREHTHDMR